MLTFVSFIGISIMLLFFGYGAFVAVNIIKSYIFFVTKTSYKPPITFMMVFVVVYSIFCFLSIEIILWFGIVAVSQ